MRHGGDRPLPVGAGNVECSKRPFGVVERGAGREMFSRPSLMPNVSSAKPVEQLSPVPPRLPRRQQPAAEAGPVPRP